MSKSEDDWHAQETYRSMIEFGQGMLRFTFLANGAAVISIMTFLGNLYTKGGAVPSMKVPLILFLLGILLSGVATLTTYFIQFMLFNESVNNQNGDGWGSHVRWLYTTLALIVFSMVAFAVGAFYAVSRLQ
jgi:uncharacterized membrane protein YidH (DUF202 family)